MKNILIVSHYFYPTNTPRAFRATELADELKRRGHHVSVLIGETDTFVENYSEHEKGKLDTMVVSVKDKANKKSLRSKLISLATTYLGDLWIYKKRKSFFKNIDLKNYDVIISIALPVYTHVLTIKETKKQQWNGRLIADWGDPFYLPDGNSKKYFYFEKMQENWLNEFDYNTVPTQVAADFYEKYVPREKIKVIPQGFRIDSEYQRTEHRQNVPVKFIYTGAFYKNIRNPKLLFDELLKIDRDFEFHIYTNKYDLDFTTLLEKYEKQFNGKLIVHDLIPRDELLKKFDEFDFAVNLENTVSEQVPSKLIDFAITGLPTISVKPNSINKEDLTAFLDGDYSTGVTVNLADYNIEKVTDQFEQLF